MIKYANILLVLSTSIFASEFTHTPRSGECYPASPYSKKYIKVKKFGPYISKTFTCEYICLDGQEVKSSIIGTRKVSVYFGEKGNEFVCKGYEKDMVWVETPMNPSSWGHYELGLTRPFSARGSGIQEIENWLESN